MSVSGSAVLAPHTTSSPLPRFRTARTMGDVKMVTLLDVAKVGLTHQPRVPLPCFCGGRRG
ncbi:hypothetical protein E2C01_057735 [Portunus trituberculatus]|uniref:Uncharacterized protein n=1 Tax=Portunus trituberculatus TaxID=210409 RepID=A0A5B7H471_PORTR|nr:hypothetical protein [Portunus trituberculatus]